MHASRYRKKPNRLPGHDYSQPGCYFVTLCTEHRTQMLGTVSDGEARASDIGEMVLEEWQRLPSTFPGVALDAWMLMPDHLHGILVLGSDPAVAALPDLGTIIRAFKGVTTSRYFHGVRSGRWPPVDRRLWQLRFHDRIVRSDRELAQIREYIAGNPARWSQRHRNAP